MIKHVVAFLCLVLNFCRAYDSGTNLAIVKGKMDGDIFDHKFTLSFHLYMLFLRDKGMYLKFEEHIYMHTKNIHPSSYPFSILTITIIK
jgi:hypothetical protein